MSLFITAVFLSQAQMVRSEDEQPAAGSGRVDEFEQIEEGDGSAASEPEPEAEAEVKTAKPSKGGNRAKEAEGSKAPNRFEADVVSKSRYKQLEVDPD